LNLISGESGRKEQKPALPRNYCATTDFSRALTKKEVPLPGPRNRHHRIAYSDRRSATAASAFAASLLFTFGDETGLLDGLSSLLVGLLAAALLLAASAALLVLLFTLVRHQLLLDLPREQRWPPADRSKSILNVPNRRFLRTWA